MESRAAKMIAWLIPPACREEVLGDLHEESAGIATMLHTAACCVISRIRRTSDPVVLLMEAFALYCWYTMVAEFEQPALLADPFGLLRLAIPAAAMLLMLAIADAYRDPKTPRVYSSFYTAVLGIRRDPRVPLAAIAGALSGYFLLPLNVAMLGMGYGALLLLIVRWAFPPVVDQLQFNNAPAFWQKLELALGPSSKWIVAVVIVVLLSIVMRVVHTVR